MKNKNIIKIILGRPFKLNVRLGNTLFRNIVKIKGIEYKHGKGFIVKDYSILPRINSLLSHLNIELIPYILCIICESDVNCQDCIFKDNCKKDIRFCVCNKCIESNDIWTRYSRAIKDIAFTLLD
jgi:hypothetical protein